MANNGNFLEKLAIAVSGGSTVREAAAAVGCSVSHAYHLSATPEFQTKVNELRSEATQAAVGRLSNAASKAVETLIELLGSKEPKDRLNAAKAILATLVPLSEFGELRARIDKLESRQQDQTATQR